MKVLLNATALRVAGGRSVARNLLLALRDVATGHAFVAYVPPNCGYEELAGGNLTVVPVPESFRTVMHGVPSSLFVGRSPNRS